MTIADQSANQTVSAEKSQAEVFADKYSNRSKVLARANDDQAAFGQFIANVFDEANPYKDWASENAPKLGTAPSLAMVLCEENGENRLIAIASKDAMFGTGGDEVAKETAYRMLCNRAMNVAGKADSSADMFATISGFLKAKFDLSAFKEFARDVVKVLHAKGLIGVTVPTLKLALSNAAFAKANFPMVTPEQWDVIFAIFTNNAEQHSMDTSIFAHWKKTRDNMTDAGATLESFDLESFQKALDEEDEGDTSAS